MWSELLSKVVEQVLLAVLPVLAGAATAYVIGLAKTAWAKARAEVGENWVWALEEGAQMAVRAAEQLKIAELIEDKKDYAVGFLQNYLDGLGLKVDLSLVEAAIEAAVIENFPHK